MEYWARSQAKASGVPMVVPMICVEDATTTLQSGEDLSRADLDVILRISFLCMDAPCLSETRSFAVRPWRSYRDRTESSSG
jgi:hypothetical protein